MNRRNVYQLKEIFFLRLKEGWHETSANDRPRFVPFVFLEHLRDSFGPCFDSFSEQRIQATTMDVLFDVRSEGTLPRTARAKKSEI